MRPDTLTPQGRRTRAALIRAAEKVFAHRGYARTRITDIPAKAAVSVGTFYSYFSSKEEIFAAMVDEYRIRLRAHLDVSAGADPLIAIRDLNRRYLEIFGKNPRLWGVLEEAALSIPELRPAVAACRREFSTAAISIIRATPAGMPPLDPALSALALTAMTEQCAAQWFSSGTAGGPDPLAAAADRLTAMWARVLGLGVVHDRPARESESGESGEVSEIGGGGEP